MGACAHVLVFYISLLGEWKKKLKRTKVLKMRARVCVYVCLCFHKQARNPLGCTTANVQALLHYQF